MKKKKDEERPSDTRHTMAVTVDLQIAYDSDNLPGLETFERWVQAATTKERLQSEISIRLVGEEESASLNETWRSKKGSTNILSFPAELPEGLPFSILGDLVICVPVIEKEAVEQNKKLDAHWAHIVIHGTLHLLGYDHVEEREAMEMESLETHIMKQLGYNDPYEEEIL